MKEWAHKCILPLFVYFWPSRVIYPTRGESDVGVTSFPWSIDSTVEDPNSVYVRAAAVLTGIWTHILKTRSSLTSSVTRGAALLSTFPIGRLGFKERGSCEFSLSRMLLSFASSRTWLVYVCFKAYTYGWDFRSRKAFTALDWEAHSILVRFVFGHGYLSFGLS